MPADLLETSEPVVTTEGSPDLQARSPLHIKDDAAATLWAEQPLSLPVVAQPERPATDGPLRHEHRAAGTAGEGGVGGVVDSAGGLDADGLLAALDGCPPFFFVIGW